MKTGKKILMISLLAVLGSVCLSGCKKKEDASKKIVFWHTMGKTNQASVEAMVKEFLKLPENEGYTIELLQQGGYTDINEKILKGMSAGNLPTMAFCYPDHVADYLAAGVVEELSSYVEASNQETEENPDSPYQFNSSDYITSFWEEGKEYDTQGSLYSVPFSKSTEVLFYNKTFFDNHGFEAPETWDDVILLCQQILALPEIQAIEDYEAPLGYDSDDNLFISFCEQLGLPYTSLGADGKGSFDFNNENTRAMVQTVKDWYDEGYIVTKGLLGNNTYTSTKFTEQKLHMTIGSTGGTSYNYPSNDAFEVGVTALPQWNPDEPSCISQGPSIVFFNKGDYVSKEQKEVAWRFYTYITNPENSAKYAISTGYEPVRISSYETPVYEAFLSGYNEETGVHSSGELKAAVGNLTRTLQDWYFTSPVFVGSATARNQVGAIIPAVCAGGKTVEAAFQEAYNKCVFAVQ